MDLWGLWIAISQIMFAAAGGGGESSNPLCTKGWDTLHGMKQVFFPYLAVISVKKGYSKQYNLNLQYVSKQTFLVESLSMIKD